MAVSINSKNAMAGSFEGISHKRGGLQPQLARTGAVLPQHPFEFNKEGNQENGYIMLLFLGRKALVRTESKQSQIRSCHAGVGVT